MFVVGARDHFNFWSRSPISKQLSANTTVLEAAIFHFLVSNNNTTKMRTSDVEATTAQFCYGNILWRMQNNHSTAVEFFSPYFSFRWR